MEYRITCYTSSNERMEGAYQWDANRTIKIAGVDFDDNLVYQVHFCNRRSHTAFVLAPTRDTIQTNGINTEVLVTEIPIELLEMPDAIDVYIYSIDGNDEMMTVASGKIIVSPRQRPANYVSQSTGGVLDVANGFVIIDGMLYLARDGVAIGTGIDISNRTSDGASAGSATLMISGGVSDIGGDTIAVTKLLSGEIPLINAVRYPVNNAVGNAMICDARPMRCTTKDIYEIPAGKTATVSCAVSGMQITGWQMNDRFICTGNSFSTWQDFPLVIDNTSGSESMLVALNFRRSDNSDVSPSDFGTIIATL